MGITIRLEGSNEVLLIQAIEKVLDLADTLSGPTLRAGDEGSVCAAQTCSPQSHPTD